MIHVFPPCFSMFSYHQNLFFEGCAYALIICEPKLLRFSVLLILRGIHQRLCFHLKHQLAMFPAWLWLFG